MTHILSAMLGAALAALCWTLWDRRRFGSRYDTKRAQEAAEAQQRALREAGKVAIHEYDTGAERRADDGSSLADTLDTLRSRK